MTVLDTSILIKRSKQQKTIKENITEVSVVEYPLILEYKQFKGQILLLDRDDTLLAVDIQKT